LLIEAISTSNNDGKRSSLSKSMLQLNECNSVIRMHIEPDTAFSLELVKWTSARLRSSSSIAKANRLLDDASKHPELHPNQLREKIVQTRAEIADLAAQQRQEQDEIQRERAYQLQELSIKIAEDSRRDSRTMRGIAWVTMAFLPATFVTSFFGMNFFDGVSGKPVFDGTSRNIWVFFVIALPISAMVLVIFWWWDRKTRILEHIEQEAREQALSS
jgi:Mg2+ and Co2+ transporter CorA